MPIRGGRGFELGLYFVGVSLEHPEHWSFGLALKPLFFLPAVPGFGYRKGNIPKRER